VANNQSAALLILLETRFKPELFYNYAIHLHKIDSFQYKTLENIFFHLIRKNTMISIDKASKTVSHKLAYKYCKSESKYCFEFSFALLIEK